MIRFRQTRAIVFVCLLAVVGAVFALRGWPSLRRVASGPSAAFSEESGKPALQPLEIRPDKSTIESLLTQTKQAITSRAAVGLGRELAPSATDLADASTELFRAAIFPDFDRFEAFRLARGFKRPMPATEQERTSFGAGIADMFLSPFSLDRMDVRILVREGVELAQPDEGFVSRMTTTISPSYPGPQDAIKQKTTVAEVRIPVQRRCLKTGEHLNVVVGYRFVWDSRSRRWFPQSIVQYLTKNGAVTTLPL